MEGWVAGAGSGKESDFPGQQFDNSVYQNILSHSF